MSTGVSGFLQSPAGVIAAIAMLVPVGYLLWKEVRKIPASLHVLMWTAFIDMLGLLMVLPLLPFYAEELAGSGFRLGLGAWSFHVGIGTISALLVTAFTVAMLISAPLWGRFSDRWGRRPALLVALAASAIAYFIFGFATSLFVLFLSRIVQGAGGGTVGVIQAYVADATEPQNRARSLGWLSAATNAGVALGPVLGSLALSIGGQPVSIGGRDYALGRAAPGVFAGLLCLVNMLFAWRYLTESRPVAVEGQVKPKITTSRSAVKRVITHSGEPAARLIWIYAIAMGAFNGVTAILALFLAARFAVNEKTIGIFFTYIGVISVLTRVLILGRAVDKLGEARLSRIGSGLLAAGLMGISLSTSLPMLAVAVALVPLGTAFTFPCVTSLLSRVIPNHERGLYMGVQQTFGGVARVIFPLMAGLMFDHWGKAWPFWISAAMVAGTILLSIGLDTTTAPQVARPSAS